jgi:hypothetical protein
MEVMKEYGLVRAKTSRIVPHGRNSPNILMAEEFAVHIDGFSLEVNLTQHINIRPRFRHL